MRIPQPGNGSGKFDVGVHDMGGWVQVVAGGTAPQDGNLPFYLAHGSRTGSGRTTGAVTATASKGPPGKNQRQESRAVIAAVRGSRRQRQGRSKVCC